MRVPLLNAILVSVVTEGGIEYRKKGKLWNVSQHVPLPYPPLVEVLKCAITLVEVLNMPRTEEEHQAAPD